MFTAKELRRRRARLQNRLEYLQQRAEEEARPGFSYIAQEASALQTALVLYDEEIERTEVGGVIEVHAMHREGPLQCTPWELATHGVRRRTDDQSVAGVDEARGAIMWSVGFTVGDMVQGTAETLAEAMALADAELRARGFIVEGLVTHRAKRVDPSEPRP